MGLGLLYSDFIDKEPEVEGGEAACSSPRSLGVVTLEFSLQRKTGQTVIMQVNSPGT